MAIRVNYPLVYLQKLTVLQPTLSNSLINHNENSEVKSQRKVEPPWDCCRTVYFIDGR